MNWAILTGHTKFITYLFRYTDGMDDGDIMGFKVFDIMPYDDIGSLHTKNRIAMGELLHSYAARIADGTLNFFPQPDDEPTYYPKRTREDGFIDWHQPSEVIHRLVRAVAPPYPGAMTRLGALEVPVLAGQPFDSGLFDPAIPAGTVVDVNLSLNRLAVKTGDSAYLINDLGDFDPTILALGDQFDSVSQDTVFRQARARYPEWVPLGQRVI
jgi:methionyl-tRNA formyltransferase